MMKNFFFLNSLLTTNKVGEDSESGSYSLKRSKSTNSVDKDGMKENGCLCHIEILFIE